MSWKSIGRRSWSAFLDSFRREHDGWLVTVETEGAVSPLPETVRMLPLRGLRLEPIDGRNRVVVTLGPGPGHERREEILIEQPTRVFVNQSARGVHRSLAIESDDARLLLRFRVEIPSEMVDGA